MKIKETAISGLYIIEPVVWSDPRGYFFESFRKDLMENAGIQYNWVQENEAYSTYGVIRGLHFQKGEHAQAKLVRVISGEVLDVVVDLRPDSPTYGSYHSVLLSGQNKRQFLIPRGFAHGYVVLSSEAIFAYKCDNYYNQPSESGIRYDDPELAIDWTIPETDRIISDKDLSWILFHEL